MDEIRGGATATVAPSGTISVRGTATMLVVAAATLFVLREMRLFAAPVLVSILLAYAVEPLVDVFMRCRLPRAAAVLAAAIVIALASFAGVRAASRQITAFVDALPTTVAAIERAALRRGDRSSDDAPGPVQHLQRAATDLQAALDAAGASSEPQVRRVAVARGFDVRDYLLPAWNQMLLTGAQLIVSGMLTLVLLLAGDRIKRKVVHAAGPDFEDRLLTAEVIRDIDRRIQRYLAARVLISGIVAAATAIAMWALGVREPLVLGVIAGVLNVVPFIGPAIGVAVCASVAFVQFHTVPVTLEAGALATLVAALEGNLVTPWLTGRAGEMNTVAVFVSVLFWGWMWSVWGLLLAVPIMVSIKAAADRIEPLQPLGELLGP